MAEKQEFTRKLKSRHIQLMALGGTIGTGLFLGSGKAIHAAGPAIFLAYLITGIICFGIMRALGELLLSDLHYHSFMDAIRDYLGNRVSFVMGWAYWVCWLALAMAEVTAIGLYFQLWFPQVPQWLPGLITLLILLGLNLMTVSTFGELEFWFALIKILAIIILIAVGVILVLLHFHSASGYLATPANLVNDGGFFATGTKGFMLSFQMVVFAFVGIEMVGVTAAEAENPKVVIPKAINGIPVRIMLFYIGALAVIMCIYQWSKLSPTGRMLAELTSTAHRPVIRKISRLSKRSVPATAVIISAVVIGIAAILNLVIPEGVFTFVSSIATTSFLFVWAAIILAHLKYIRQHPQSRTFKMPGAPFTDYVTLVFLFIVLIVLCMEKQTLIALILTLAWFAILAVASLTQKKA